MDRRRPRNPPGRPLVLIVEADDDSRAMYALALSAMGFDVVAAQGGTEAYRRAWDIHPDIIVTDLPRPDGDAWQLLDNLKQDPRTRDIPVVAMSGSVRQSLRHEGMNRDGFAAFFPKPCLPDDLAAGLRQVLYGTSVQWQGADGTLRRCPQCNQHTLVLSRHYAVLADTIALARTGTDPHDGRDRLHYRTAWVCVNAECRHRAFLDQESGIE
jgi:CheY-like chemotaxis protein